MTQESRDKYDHSVLCLRVCGVEIDCMPDFNSNGKRAVGAEAPPVPFKNSNGKRQQFI